MMREQDAYEICTYVEEQVRPAYETKVYQPQVIVYPNRAPEGPEAHVLIPIDGARTARQVLARLVSEMGFAAQLPIPLDRAEIACSLETFNPRELKIPHHRGMLWGLSVSSRLFVKLPDVQAFGVEDLLAEYDETAYGPDAVPSYDFDLPYKDSQADEESRESEQNPFAAELRDLAHTIALRLVEQRDGRSKFVSPYTMPLPADGHANIVAVHGFNTSFAAVRFGQDVVSNLGKICATSLANLGAPAIDFSLSWKKQFVISFVEAVRKNSA